MSNAATENATLFNMINKISETDFGIMHREASIMMSGLSLSFRLYVSTLKVLDDDTFWEMLEELRERLNHSIPNKLEGIQYADIKRSTDQFVWEYAYGRKSDRLNDAVRFVQTYDAKVAALYKPLFDEIDGFGDDGYSDILDSFPLFGRTTYELALKSQLCGDSEKQYQGENYISTRLMESTFEYFASVASHEATDIQKEEMGEDAYYVDQRRIYKKLGLKCDID